MEMTVRDGTPVRGVIFDKDGTLHDTERVFRRAWLAAGEEMNVPDMEDTILHCTGMNLHDIGLYWAQKYPDIPFEPYIRLRNRIFDQLVAERIPLRPGAMEVLHTLRARGYRLGLATSTNRTEATDHLRRTGMLELFDGLAFGDMVRDGKPAPDIYLLAARLIGLPPDACAGVEDSLNGVRAIHNAGMRPIMVPDLIRPTEDIRPLLWAECESLADIPDILAHGR